MQSNICCLCVTVIISYNHLNSSTEHWFLKMATRSCVKIEQMCDKGEHSMESWPCLIDIVYFSANMITKLVASHSLSIYCNSHTQTCWTIAHSGVMFWHQHTTCCLSVAETVTSHHYLQVCFWKKYLLYGHSHGTSSCMQVDGHLWAFSVTSSGDCWCKTYHLIFP
jgi:hypothetical protein